MNPKKAKANIDLSNQKINNSNNNYKKISNRNLKANKENLKQLNSKEVYNLNNLKFKQIKNNAANNNNKTFNNTFYKSRNENNNRNNFARDTHRDNHHKFVVDVKESIKHGRNTSAPALKSNDKNKNNYYNLIHNTNKKYNNKLNEKKKDKSSLKVDSINTRINRINLLKQNFISKTNKKLYNNSQYNDPSYKTSNNVIKNKDFDDYNTIKKQNRENQERIAMMEKKLREEKMKLRNNNNNYSYNINMNHTINVDKRIPNYNDNDNSIDNEEKIITSNDNLTDDNKDYTISHFQNNNYRDITPDKGKINKNKYNNSYMNNFDSIDVSDGTTSKTGISNIKDKSKNDKNKSKAGYSYTKKSDFIKKIHMPKIYRDKDKDLFNNNYNLYNNTINTERIKNNKKKSKKINVINLKTKDNNYYYTKSSNVFNTVNNKLNKSSILPNNKNIINNASKERKNRNKIKLNNNIKKNNSVSKTRIKTDYNNNNNNKGRNLTIGKRNLVRPKIGNKKQNSNLNYTYEKINTNKFVSEASNPKNKEKINLEEFKNEEEEEKKIEEEKEEAKKNIRIIDKIGCICHAGEVSFGKPKTNQDNYFNYNIKSNLDDLVFVGVCDGHGENGHYVSKYLIDHLPLDFEVDYLNNSDNNSFENIPLEKITKIFEESFLKTDNNLNTLCDEMKEKKLLGENNHDFFNCDYSGSTCVSIFLKKNDISTVYIANVGDSRVIVIKENPNNIWTFEQLSRDHKPTEEDEYKRIIEADGEIEAIEDDDGNWTGPLRVWEKGSEGPGLAMTRSLGDKVGTKIGVVCTPEISKYSIKDEDRAFIIASDGLWEYMPNQDVTEAVKELILDMRENNEISADIIANELFKQSVIRWRQKEPGMDDITIICVLLR